MLSEVSFTSDILEGYGLAAPREDAMSLSNLRKSNCAQGWELK